MDKVLVSLCGMPQQQYTYDQMIAMACRQIAKLHEVIDEQERQIAFLEDTKPW